MQLVIIAIMLTLIIVSIYYEQAQLKKRIYQKLKKEYGKIPITNTNAYDEISLYWREFNHRIPEDEKIDDITWNDLEMTQLFNRINSTKSFAGEQMLYSELHHLPKNKESLNELEKAISYYETHSKAREEMQFQLWCLGKESVSYYLPVFMNNLDVQFIPHMWKYHMLQILLVLSFLPGIITGNTLLFAFVGIAFLINVTVYTLKKSQYELYMETLGSIIHITKLVSIISHNKARLYSEVPVDIQEKLKSFNKLTHMISNLQKRKQASVSGDAFAVFQSYIVGSTLWDFTRYNKVIKYLQGQQRKFMALYSFIAKIDMEIAIASFRQSVPVYCTPEFVIEKTFTLENMYHPLLKDAVYNSLKIKQHCLITGSNASGKSTFIKGVALNTILAQSIHTCLASSMLLPDAHVITSMAVRDDIIDGESYYIKEIRYLKRIVTASANSRYVLCVIDEILRGTNTNERIAASTAILNYLKDGNCLAIVATHDIELTTILKDQYLLYYFTEQIKEKDIVFDYKIHEGACSNRNAIRLLEYAGFPKVIIDEAKAL